MARDPIDPISIAQVRPGREVSPAPRAFTGNPFEDILSRAVDAMEDVSKTEIYANELINRYVEGKAELSDVLVATAKASIAVQLAVTTITTAVTTFKEITQMPV